MARLCYCRTIRLLSSTGPILNSADDGFHWIDAIWGQDKFLGVDGQLEHLGQSSSEGNCSSNRGLELTCWVRLEVSLLALIIWSHRQKPPNQRRALFPQWTEGDIVSCPLWADTTRFFHHGYFCHITMFKDTHTNNRWNDIHYKK